MVLGIELSKALIQRQMLDRQRRDDNAPILNLDAHALIGMQMRLARNTHR